MAENKMITKKDLLTKLRDYKESPDDDVIRIKKKIEKIFLQCPEILYALNEKKLESELFDDDGNINWEWNEELGEYEPLGEWDNYIGSTANIRPFLFIPDTQTEVKHYICYQVGTDENVRYNTTEKLLNITFTIFVHGNDRVDKLTGIPRHDLLAALIRENFAWTGFEIEKPTPIGNKESTTDNNYLVRTLQYQCVLPNDLVISSNGTTSYKNKRW